MGGATTKTKRKIIKIDEEKCDGCGLCALSCAEGALQIIDGKAKLVSEDYCDGLGACIGECPQGALTIEEREAPEFDEEAVKHYLQEKRKAEAELPCGCPSCTVTQIERPETEIPAPGETAHHESMLSHWPVQLRLVPPTAPFLKNADLLLVADCVPFAYADFHRDFLKDHAVLVACPKLDDFDAHLEKLTAVVRQAQPRSLTVIRMEVPCCFGLVHMVKQAVAASGQDIPIEEVVISARGECL
ncbi:MAG: 4Fe-4S ferredoxin [Chloroflexi bacterium]|nr:4Fe-4S ferredoxin [Chloroflexota bacterium]